MGDQGHYNCRDYYVSPHFAPTTISVDRPQFERHESWQQLEERSRSPPQAPFAFLRLPLELRQQVYAYLLPRTQDHNNPNPLADHARNFSAVQKRGARGMIIPQANATSKGPSHVVWQRGNIHLMSVCRQVHDECAELLYGCNSFLLFVTFQGITFRFSWLLPSGLAPTRRYDFLELLPAKYLPLIKRAIINLDHVDSYTAMLKFNVSGKGLTQGLRKQVQRLVNALRTNADAANDDEKRLAKIGIRVSNGNAFLDREKSEIVRQREGAIKVSEDLEVMLEPFGDLRGVREVQISGAVTDKFAASLKEKMMSLGKLDEAAIERSLKNLEMAPSPQLCVYGNDMT
ncbi:unnamed protein product [Zymoseptoria tritici ST99CH_1A5]|uniref:DUF7730 domain-containing protein n=2 Tax=Zymoseptoria tritici TaxID=1047171 RepID=A0A1X7S0U0_ZYMT9|nr:unnamed protein product [Zymoseptoria tritici ST99CH_3D7]SMR59488.1 unnamed protein product [Zymoseptoria tritici ST99CH_3D1]SMY26686.1 unnamed protein product [Zymoseptoria tritici ST99CH_1A5]